MGAVEEPEQVHLDHLPPLVRRRAGHRPKQHHSGVVDEHVEAAELVVRPGDERVRLLLVGDVRRDCERTTSVLFDPAREVRDPILAAGRQRNGGPFGRERQRGRLTDPGGGAGYCGNFAFECGHAASVLAQARGQRTEDRPRTAGPVLCQRAVGERTVLCPLHSYGPGGNGDALAASAATDSASRTAAPSSALARART